MSDSPLPQDHNDEKIIAGKYKIIDHIGEGGMGTVYKVRHKLLNEVQALKIIKPVLLADPQFKERFLREAVLARKVRDVQGVIRVHDVGDTQDGGLYIAMEYIKGSTLGDILRHAPKGLPIDDVLAIAKKIGIGLAALHAADIIHRDLKPDNIMLVGNDKTPLAMRNVKLLDFGLAKAIDGTQISHTGMVMGTPRYMSPEQCKGLPLTSTSDIYSFGIIVYQMLIGETPFDSESAIGYALHHLQTPPPDLSAAKSLIPPGINESVLRALEKESALRFQTASAFVDALFGLGITKTVAIPRADGEINSFTSFHRAADLEDAKEAEKADQEKATDDQVNGKEANNSADIITDKPNEDAPVNKHYDTFAPPADNNIKPDLQNDKPAFDENLHDFQSVIENAPLDNDQDDDGTIYNKEQAFSAEPIHQFERPKPAEKPQPNQNTNIDAPNWLIPVVAVMVIIVLAGGYFANKNGFFDDPILDPVPETVSLTLDIANGLQFVEIPAGEFPMGSPLADPDEKPVHIVQILTPFQMSATEVSQVQWQFVMGSNPSKFFGNDLPVEQVSWDSAQAFIGKLNSLNDGYHYRLPYEAEWEYAARAGSNAEFSYGQAPAMLNAYGWSRENADSISHPVGQKIPNKWGLYDMHGNVWEWCQDYYDANYYSIVTDPTFLTGPDTGLLRVIRGGSWYDEAVTTRSANRLALGPQSHGGSLGLRLVREKISR